MIEEEAIVAEVGDGVVWIVRNRPSGCSACSESCPSSLASRFFPPQQFRLRVDSNLPLQSGDKVLIGIADDSLTQVSFAIYLIPLVCFFAGALVGIYLNGSDLSAAIGGLLGLGLCFAGFSRFGLFDRQSLKPVILRKIK
jgi:sigma-E factor negative regulatory protein RseC